MALTTSTPVPPDVVDALRAERGVVDAKPIELA
jgi:hypothetical protein